MCEAEVLEELLMRRARLFIATLCQQGGIWWGTGFFKKFGGGRKNFPCRENPEIRDLMGDIGA